MADARLARALFVVSLAVSGVVAAYSGGAGASSIALRAGGRAAQPPVVGGRTATFLAAGGLIWKRASGRAT